MIYGYLEGCTPPKWGLAIWSSGFSAQLQSGIAMSATTATQATNAIDLLAPGARFTRRSLVPLSVILHGPPASDSVGTLLEVCRRCAAGCELELVVLYEQESSIRQFRKEQARGGPLTLTFVPRCTTGDPRNAAIAQSRFEHLLLLDDQAIPATDDFFRAHASLHASCPEPDFVVLGKTCWGAEDRQISLQLAQVLADVSWLAPEPPAALTFVGKQYFSDANISFKKSLIQDWTAGGFAPGFPGAVGALELAYRIAPAGLRLFYDPSAVAACRELPPLSQMLSTFHQAGKSLRKIVSRYPDALCDLSLQQFYCNPASTASAQPAADYHTRILRAWQAWARCIDRRPGVQCQPWYPAFLRSVLELSLLEGFSMSPAGECIPAPCGEAIVQRLLQRFRQTLHGELSPLGLPSISTWHTHANP